MTSLDTPPPDAPAGFRLGDPIALEDLLALPPDGCRYDRDEAGRLTLMAPDDARRHRRPLARMCDLLVRAVEPPGETCPEPSLAFPRIFDRKGAVSFR